MSIPNLVTKIRLWYHLNSLDIYNAANQLHMISDSEANEKMKEHTRQCFDCYDRLGYNLPDCIKEWIKS